MKIERNDPCYCGSGKKYKKCCIDKEPFLGQNSSVFAEYDKIDLIKTVASLSLVPENMDKIVRLESMMNEVLKLKDDLNEKITLQSLKKICDKHFAYNLMEDPTENCFTDIVIFYGGDYIIFPGITEHGNFVLQLLLTTIFEIRANPFPKEFDQKIHDASLFVLAISDLVAKNLGYKRYEKCTSEENLVTVPDLERLNKIKQKIEFSESEMESFLKNHSIPPQTINNFTFDLLENITEDVFVNRPIIKVDSGYIIASPSTLSYALTNYIWEESREQKIDDYLEKSYSTYWWNEAQLKFRKMGFARFTLENNDVDHNETNGFYQFDSDKVAFIYIKDKEDKYISRLNQLKYTHLENNEYSDHKIIEIEIIPVLGLDSFTLQENGENESKLYIPMTDFDILSSLRLTDAIGLWKYEKVSKDKRNDGFLISLSTFLDDFKYYNDNDDSFYQTEYSSCNASEWRIKSKIEKDLHSKPQIVNGKIKFTKVEKLSRLENVYFQQRDKSNLLVDTYFQPIWITPQSRDFPKEAQIIVEGISNVIAFWISEIEEFFKEPLRFLGEEPVQFEFLVSDWQKFIKPLESLNKQKLSIESFSPLLVGKKITLTIPIDFVKHAYGPQNQGERELLRTIIFSLNKLLETYNLPQLHNCDEIISLVAPLGPKKKLNVHFPDDNLLRDPTNVVRYRLLQSHDVNIVLDKITNLLGSDCPIQGRTLSYDEKVKLLNDIIWVALIPLLKEKVYNLNFESLLIKLIQFNEAIIQKRARLNFEIPSKIACDLNDDESKSELNKLFKDLDNTSISIRCLLEYVAVEQISGQKRPSVTDIDELIAIMNQIFQWGSLHDQISLGVLDERIDVLTSGRIGSDKKLQKLFNEFSIIKTKEKIDDSFSNFIDSFPLIESKKGKEIPNGLNEAFALDYGITFLRLVKLIHCLVSIGKNKNMSYCKVNSVELFVELKKFGLAFNEIELKNGFEYLRQIKRIKINDVPDGFEPNDTIVYKFNRRMSILNKPLIRVDKTSALPEFYFWGNKQLVQTMHYLQNQIETGRFRPCLKSNGMKQFIGEMGRVKGEILEKEIANILEKHDKIHIHRSLLIKKKSKFYSKIDLGDVDILILDIKNRLIFSLECKAFAPTRSVKELNDELTKLYIENKYIEKHMKRHNWLEKNRNILSQEYGYKLDDFKIQSVFVTAEQLFTPLFKGKSIEMPFITKYDIEKNGYNALLNLAILHQK